MIYFQSQVDALLKAKDEKIALLESILATQAKAIEFEKKRADAAIDQVIALSGGRPVTPPPAKKVIVDKILEQVSLISRAGRDFGESPEPDPK